MDTRFPPNLVVGVGMLVVNGPNVVWLRPLVGFRLFRLGLDGMIALVTLALGYLLLRFFSLGYRIGLSCVCSECFGVGFFNFHSNILMTASVEGFDCADALFLFSIHCYSLFIDFPTSVDV